MENVFEYLNYEKIALHMPIDDIISLYESMPDGYNKKSLGILFIKSVVEKRLNKIRKTKHMPFIKKLLATYNTDIEECIHGQYNKFVRDNSLMVRKSNNHDGGCLLFESVYAFSNFYNMYKNGEYLIDMFGPFIEFEGISDVFDDKFIDKDEHFQKLVLQYAIPMDVAEYVCHTIVFSKDNISQEFFDMCVSYTDASSLLNSLYIDSDIKKLRINDSDTEKRRFLYVLDVINKEYPDKRYDASKMLSLLSNEDGLFTSIGDDIVTRVLKYMSTPSVVTADILPVLDMLVGQKKQQLIFDNINTFSECSMSILMLFPYDILEKIPITSNDTILECISRLKPMLKKTSSMYKIQAKSFLIMLKNAIINSANDNKWGKELPIDIDIMNIVFKKHPELNNVVSADKLLLLRI